MFAGEFPSIDLISVEFLIYPILLDLDSGVEEAESESLLKLRGHTVQYNQL